MTRKAPRQAKDSASITRSQPFAAHIGVGEDGVTKKLIVESKMWYQHALNKFKAGEKVTLEIHNRRSKRTEAQNRFYWGVYLPLIAKETGEHNLDALHELFKGKFLSEGIVEVLGQKVRLKKSTTELAIGEFSEFIMNIEAETGIEAPPTENYNLAPLRGALINQDHGEQAGDEGGEGSAGAGGDDSAGDSKAVETGARTPERPPKEKGRRRVARKRDTDVASDRV